MASVEKAGQVFLKTKAIKKIEEPPQKKLKFGRRFTNRQKRGRPAFPHQRPADFAESRIAAIELFVDGFRFFRKISALAINISLHPF